MRLIADGADDVLVAWAKIKVLYRLKSLRLKVWLFAIEKRLSDVVSRENMH